MSAGICADIEIGGIDGGIGVTLQGGLNTTGKGGIGRTRSGAVWLSCFGGTVVSFRELDV